MGGPARVALLEEGQFDQRFTLYGVSWESYEALLRDRGESKGVRMAFLDGALELESPSNEHEVRAERICHLVLTWAEVFGVRMEPTGSWTVRKKRKKRGLEPDKSFVLGPTMPSVPDLAVEVVWTGGGIDKLEIYRGLGVKEVWVWQRGAFEIFVLGREGYTRRRKSAVLPGLDLALLARFVEVENTLAATRAYRRALRRH